MQSYTEVSLSELAETRNRHNRKTTSNNSEVKQSLPESLELLCDRATQVFKAMLLKEKPHFDM